MSADEPRSYTPEMVAASPNDLDYFRRREVLYRRLDDLAPVSCAELADDLGWPSEEVRAKLMSLRKDLLVCLDGGQWEVEYE